MPVAFYSMSDSARPPRKYDSTRRKEQAALTHARVVEAAASLFVERGYVATTVPAIGERAGVAVETVYRAAASKAGLLAAAVQHAVAGGADRADVPVDARPAIRAVIDETDPRRKLAFYAATQPGIWSRAGALLTVLDEAAPSDTELAALRAEHSRQRLDGMRRFATDLASTGSLRSDLDAAGAADVLFTLCAHANYDALVGHLGWTHDRYRDWLARMLVAGLLE